LANVVVIYAAPIGQVVVIGEGKALYTDARG
jgi:hypothetical protein